MSEGKASAYGQGKPPATHQLIIHGRDMEQKTVYSWARNGHMHSTRSEVHAEIPYDATEIKVKLFTFACGIVREIYLAKGARTHPHGSYDAVLFYQVDGRRVQVVNEHSFEVNPGDVTLEPCGVLHSTHQLIGGLFIEFALPAATQPNAEATWMTAAQAETAHIAEWLDDGKLIRATGENAAAAPPDAARYRLRVYPLPGYTLIETTLAMGTVIPPRPCAVDQLFYVVKGKLQVSIADTRDEVVTGDAMHSLAGRGYSFTAAEDTVFLQTAIMPPPSA